MYVTVAAIIDFLFKKNQINLNIFDDTDAVFF